MHAGHLIGIFLRSMLINSSLNFKRMQNAGFAFSLLPILHVKKSDSTSRVQFLKRHLSYFSTNPQIVAPVLGVVTALEERNDAEVLEDYIIQIKSSMAGPFAAIGDVFLGKGLRPLSSIFAVLAAFFYIVWAPLIFIVFYVPPQLWLRIRGFIDGYRRGLEVITFFKNFRLIDIARSLQVATLFLLGVASVLWTTNSLHYLFYPINLMERAIAAWVLLVLCYLCIKRGISQVTLVYVFCVITYFSIMYVIH